MYIITLYTHTHTHNIISDMLHYSEVDPNDVFGSAILELYRTKLFVLSDLVGVATVPLASVRHSNKVRFVRISEK